MSLMMDLVGPPPQSCPGNDVFCKTHCKDYGNGRACCQARSPWVDLQPSCVGRRPGAHWIGAHWIGAHWIGAHWIVAICLVLLIGTPCPGASPPSSRHARFVEGLWQRHLYRQAELYCQVQLERSDLDDEQRADLVIQQIRTYAQHAMNTSGRHRPELWQLVAESWHRFRDGYGTEAWPDVALHFWLAEFARGQVLRLEADFTGNPADRELAVEVLRGLLRGLESLEKQVRVALRQSHTSGASQLSPQSLQALEHQIQFKIAEASREQAACFPDGSPDAVRLLTQARDRFSSLAKLVGGTDFTWACRLALIDCQRQLGNGEAARRALDQLSEVDLPSEIRLRISTLQARLDIDHGELMRGVQKLSEVLSSARTTDPAIEAEAELVLIDGYVRLAKDSGTNDQAAAAEWQRRAVARLRLLEQTKSRYWVRRAESLLTSINAGSADLADVEILARSAANQFRRKEYDAAIRTFHRAATLARQLDDSQRAFELEFQAAAIRYQRGDLAGARDAFRHNSLHNPSHGNARATHWMAVTCAAKLAYESTAQLPVYESLLQEHVRQWSEGPSLEKARFWLAKLHQQRNEWAGAINSLSRINADYDEYEEVQRRLRDCYLQQLRNLEYGSAEQADLAIQAASYFERGLAGRQEADRDLTPQHRRAAVNAAMFRLLFSEESAAKPQQLLQSVLSTNDLAEPTNSQARCLLACANLLLGGDRPQEQLASIDWSHVDLALDAVTRLEYEIASQSENSASVSQFIDALCEQLAATEGFSEKQQRDLQRVRADALVRMRRHQEAIEIYGELLDQDPTNAELHQRLAELHQHVPLPDHQQQAVNHWRQVVRLSETASTPWFQAKLAIARFHLRLGNPERAAEVVRVTQILHPDLGGPELKRQFVELLEESN